MAYIKINRDLLEWEWSDEPNTFALWIHILLGANQKDGYWHDEVVNRGQMLTSLAKLSARTGLSEKQVRVGLERLEFSNKIEKSGTPKWTMITVVDYERYSCEQDGTTPLLFQESKPVEQPTPVEENNDATKRTMTNNALKGAVGRIYALYPTKCPVSGRATGKGSKDKNKIESLIKAGHTEEELSSTINRYIQDSIRDNSFVKNFQTFLNNLPDYGEAELFSQQTQQPQQEVYYKSLEELEAARRAKKNQ